MERSGSILLMRSPQGAWVPVPIQACTWIGLWKKGRLNKTVVVVVVVIVVVAAELVSVLWHFQHK